MKNILQSRTVQLAIFQAVTSVAIVIFTEMEMLGLALAIKSMVDVLLRVDTDTAIRK